ncbi:GNAT family N-acetyltransferase [Actinokineospora sp. NPDC004072]
MRLALRADASPGIGVGHLARCAALAEEAVARRWAVTLTGDLTAGDWLVDRLTELGVEIRPDWPDADIAVVDHYGPVTPPDIRLVSIEDGAFGRRRADVVVDPALAPEPRPADGSAEVLRGPAYAPLRAAVRTARERRAARSGAPGTPPRVVVAMGGGAAGGAVSAALAALRATGLALDVLVVSAAAVDPGGPGVRVVGPRPDLPDLFAEADLVVSAAGVTLLELCCLGVPAAVAVIADNQRPGYTAAVERGLAAGLGELDDSAAGTLHHLLTTPAARVALAAAAGKVVDGQGARRILNAAARLTLRPAAQADAERLLAWRNDPGTRRWSLNPDPVSPEDHRRWLARDRHLLIAEEAGTPVGVVRFDPLPDGVEVSITIAPEARGRGLARPILEAAQDTVAGQRVHARIHEDNAASRRLFAGAGYRRTAGPDARGFAAYQR